MSATAFAHPKRTPGQRLDPVKVRRRQAALGLSQEMLALKAGVSRGSVANAALGRSMSNRIIRRIALALVLEDGDDEELLA
jgi:predicted transcriptional regulator